jgi:O-antigen ligase
MLKINSSSLIIENNLFIVPLVILSIAATVLLINYLLVGIGVIIITLLVLLYGERFLIGLIIVSLFTIVSDFGDTIRLYVQIIDFSLLGFLFLKHYGFNFAEYPKVPKQIWYFLGLYYFSMIITSILSQYFFDGIYLIVRQTVFFIIAYIFYALIKDLKYVKTYIISLIIIALILALGSIYDFMLSGNKLIDLVFSGRYRATGFISNQSKTTAFFILTLPIVITFAYSKIYKNKRKLLLSIAALLIIGLFLIISRSAILSVLSSLMIISYQLNREYFKKFAISVSIIIFIFLFFEPLNEIVSTFFRIKTGLSQRDYFWELSYNIIKDNPIWGIGPGSYKYLEFNFAPVLLNTWPGRVIIDLNLATNGENGSHNIFLKFASDMGIPGIITIFYFMWVLLRISIVNYKKIITGNRQIFLLNLVIAAALGSMFVRCMFDSIGILHYGIIVSDLPFWLLFGILIFFYQKPKEYFTSDEMKSKDIVI